MTFKIFLLAVAVAGFAASTSVMQDSIDRGKLAVGTMCGLFSILSLVGSAIVFGAIVMEVFS